MRVNLRIRAHRRNPESGISFDVQSSEFALRVGQHATRRIGLQ
jgi:hypothetical protein